MLRRTLGDLLVKAVGPRGRPSCRRASPTCFAVHKRSQRESRGVPDDPWLSAGLGDIKAVVEHFARELHERRGDFSSTDPGGLLGIGLVDLGWTSVPQVQADFERLLTDRHDEAHPDVVEPLTAARRAEAESIRQRLRLGCERVRRRLLDADDEWFPYIESVRCPGIDGWEYQRGGSQPSVSRRSSKATRSS